jgi:hypothetical protein
VQARARAVRGGRTAAAQQQRRRCGVLAVAAPGVKGKRVGKEECDAGKLTKHSNWAEEGRTAELDVQGRWSCGTAIAAVGGGVDSTGEWLEWAHRGAAEVRNGVGEVLARGIDEWQLESAGEVPTVALLGSALTELKEEEGMKRKGKTGVG